METIGKVQVVITAYKEENTISKIAAEAEYQLHELLSQKEVKRGEVIVAAPDKPTRELSLKNAKYGLVKPIKVPIKKPRAIDWLLRKKILDGDVVIFTDGDLVWSNLVILPLLRELRSDSKIGAVAGHLVPSNPKNTMLGYWAWVTTQVGAHAARLKADKQKGFLNLPGGIFAIKGRLLPSRFPHDILGDDIYFTYLVYKQGFRVSYAPDAVVYVKYPTTIKDWLYQKKRTSGAEYQIRERYPDIAKFKPMRSFKQELMYLPAVIGYSSNFREFAWGGLLAVFRFLSWAMAFIEQRVFKRNPYKVWQRIYSSKYKKHEVSNLSKTS